jgi:chromosome partitioning protein
VPVIAVASSKGGAGKTTASLTLGTTLVQKGAKGVALLDCDPNQPLKIWRAGPSRNGVRVVSDTSESTIVDAIERAAAEHQFVIIDLEGTASRLVSRAISRATLALIPLRASELDARQAARTLALVREEEQVLQRLIPSRVFLSQTSPQIPTRTEKLIVGELKRAGVPLLKTHLHGRTAYQAQFVFRLALDELDEAKVNGLAAARENASEFAAEVLATIRELAQGRAA